MKLITIAIDGYSSCGKSTLAKKLAKALSYSYVDTGAMYRAVTLYMLRKNIDPGKLGEDELNDILDKIEIYFLFNEEKGQSDTYLNDEDVEEEIRGREVSNEVSRISKVKVIRSRMAHLQKGIGLKKGIVMDGRDIGTAIFPHAEVKIFMTADPEVRALRRYKEIHPKNPDIKLDEVRENLQLRDHDDLNRKESPLQKAEDAVIIDNTHLTEEEQFEKAMEIIAQAMAKEME